MKQTVINLNNVILTKALKINVNPLDKNKKLCLLQHLFSYAHYPKKQKKRSRLHYAANLLSFTYTALI